MFDNMNYKFDKISQFDIIMMLIFSSGIAVASYFVLPIWIFVIIPISVAWTIYRNTSVFASEVAVRDYITKNVPDKSRLNIIKDKTEYKCRYHLQDGYRSEYAVSMIVTDIDSANIFIKKVVDYEWKLISEFTD